MLLRLILTILLLSFSSFVFAESAYCAKFGTAENKAIHEVCEKGDIIEVSNALVLHYCDFSKQIITSPIDAEKKACQYIGYMRKFRSRKNGELQPFTIKEK